MGYVRDPDGVVTPEFVAAGHYEIEVADQRLPARVSMRAFYDPHGDRIRA
jgi:4-methylaminobutanoate oxidase (formaldehyde-forming)